MKSRILTEFFSFTVVIFLVLSVISISGCVGSNAGTTTSTPTISANNVSTFTNSENSPAETSSGMENETQQEIQSGPENETMKVSIVYLDIIATKSLKSSLAYSMFELGDEFYVSVKMALSDSISDTISYNLTIVDPTGQLVYHTSNSSEISGDSFEHWFKIIANNTTWLPGKYIVTYSLDLENTRIHTEKSIVIELKEKPVDFEITKIIMVSEFKDPDWWKDYTPAKDNKFEVGQPIHVYIEVNFSREYKDYIFFDSVKVYDSGGNLVIDSAESNPNGNRTYNPKTPEITGEHGYRRGYDLPAFLKSGTYKLVYTTKDAKTGKTKSAEVFFTVDYGKPVRIEEFLMIDQGNYWEVQLILSNKYGAYTATSGSLKIEIKDEYGVSIYNMTEMLSNADFTWFTRVSGKELLGYVRKIYKDEVKHKGLSSSGVAYAEFKVNGNVLKAQDDIFGIPEMSDNEKEEYFEQKYLQNSKECKNCIVTKGNFKIEIVRYGWYEFPDWDGLKKYFRVDFKIMNIGNEPDYIFESDAYLIDIINNKQYGASWDSKLENNKILPGITEEGYLLFEGLPETPSRRVKLVWIVSDWPEDIYYEFYVYT